MGQTKRFPEPTPHPEMYVYDDGEWVMMKCRPNRDRDIDLMELVAKMFIHRWNQDLNRSEER